MQRYYENGTDVGKGCDAAALTALYEHFKQDVFRFIFYRVHQRDAAADLTGDVFEQMIKALPDYRPERPFAAWLFPIARHRVIDYWRQQQVRQDGPRWMKPCPMRPHANTCSWPKPPCTKSLSPLSPRIGHGFWPNSPSTSRFRRLWRSGRSR
ncbi:MAG: sigma-70 family RNA polymerase sigma factor [Chloroflexi bacterium]|nr:sigma-70 family RNA polymerase sigma factor [Chloroflexota bacterium]MBP8056965.1 sigma-70 family RNA polymerase sigma factor [Chloroflexota bacterium]